MIDPGFWGWRTGKPAFWGWQDVTTATPTMAFSLSPPPIRATLTGDIDNGYNASSYSGNPYV